ncbi:MAG: 1-(5-phosphoribosyl)-5-[(5-phosphoribosylamino)methylideneamino]imidazole-4-carboxamide isomerase [Anaerolineae bacterium]
MGKRDQEIEASGWRVYAAIDLRQGRVVRLMQGDLALETHYADDPVGTARRWKRAGAEWVHVVNLDGAFGEGGSTNLAALEGILRSVPDLHVQFGGGLRDMASIQRAMELGVSRVVLGTAAVQRASLVETALDTLGPDRVAVGIDARNGVVQTHGWQQGAGVSALDLAKHWADRGIRWLIFTDVTRNGMGRGLNLETTVRLAQVTDLNVIASGGVASLDDVRRAWEAGLSGVIIGRALYEGWVMLEDALRVPSTVAEPQKGGTDDHGQ